MKPSLIIVLAIMSAIFAAFSLCDYLGTVCVLNYEFRIIMTVTLAFTSLGLFILAGAQVIANAIRGRR